MERNLKLYPWFKFARNLIFWQAIWFLFFQQELSASEAILLYAVYDLSTTILEVPSGYMSDRLGRRVTLLVSGVAGVAGAVFLAVGDSFAAFAAAQIMFGTSAAFVSGTDSALLYQSLAALNREDEIEAQELRAWRFGFVALAISAAAGGAMALWGFLVPILASVVSAIFALIIILALRDPPSAQDRPRGEWARLASLKDSLTEPVLIWFFVLMVLMYGFSHIPFVFGQPFILEALAARGLDGGAPLVSGVVTSVMMALSVMASLFAVRLRKRLGLAAVLLGAFGMQILLAGVLALTNSALAIAFLFLRMVPDALSSPFVKARVQSMLQDESRATYVSVQSLCGRLLFAGSLYLASGAASERDAMAYSEIQVILAVYAIIGLVLLGGLAVAASRLALDRQDQDVSV